MKDRTQIQSEATFKTISDTFLKVHELQNGTLPLFLEFNHQQVITYLKQYSA
ncbi:hypothetical protein [Daejeonella sp.]|uniref:hypothetical protein n=1 Tax=Daejeonella sp. TaxID=2805397 RepID=UPI0025C0C974|nr:hypothetical protein [Daejeonella sp.]